MEFTQLMRLVDSKIKADNLIAMEYLKYQYPGEIPRAVKALLYMPYRSKSHGRIL